MLPRTIEWIGDLDGYVQIIDQTLLPDRLELLKISDIETMFEAICSLRVRGAPAIGIAAAMGLVLGVRETTSDREGSLKILAEQIAYLASSRPTAVNLSWALKRLGALAGNQQEASVGELKEMLLAEAKAIRDEDAATCRAIGFPLRIRSSQLNSHAIWRSTPIFGPYVVEGFTMVTGKPPS